MQMCSSCTRNDASHGVANASGGSFVSAERLTATPSPAFLTESRASYEFKVTVTNNKINPRKVVLFHEERGSQEGIFSELKTHCQMDYIPVNTGVGNQLYMFAGILAHNLTRELQIRLNTSRPWHHGETRRAVVLPRD